MTEPVQLPKLPYDFNALEPYINAEIMMLHYSKHHAAYVANYNKAEEQYLAAEKKGDIAAMIALQPALKFNGGGHINHSIFWKNLAPKDQGGGKLEAGALSKAIDATWTSLDKFIEEFSSKTVAIQGSGWGWLGYDAGKKCLRIVTCSNQDPLSTQGLIPLLGIDVWEHAYYLQYKNVRPDYVKNIWEIINWKDVEERYAAAGGK